MKKPHNVINKIRHLFNKLMDEELTLDEYDNRLKLQKAVFLLQEAGLPFNYYFSWYIKGPYSATLTKDVYEFMESKAAAVDEKPELTKTEEDLAAKMRKTFVNELKDTNTLELLGSLVYIRNSEGVRDMKALVETLYSRKPRFSKKQITEMAEKVEASKLFN